jgi:hypothetical protein
MMDAYRPECAVCGSQLGCKYRAELDEWLCSDCLTARERGIR